MYPNRSKIVACPFCGAKKELMTLASGNSIGAMHWSDYKVIAPNMPKVSPVQKCLECGKYYLESNQPFSWGKKFSFEQGELTYMEWKEAYNQFANDGSISKKDLTSVMFWLIQAYNDYYHRPNYMLFPSPTVDPKEEAFITNIIYKFIDVTDWSKEPLVLKAELYREAGDMEKSLQVLSCIPIEGLNDAELYICAGIKRKIKTGNKKVFNLYSLDLLYYS